MAEKTILFYNDSEVFGGHEIMTVRIINSLARQNRYSLHCLYHAPAFTDQLDPAVTCHPLPFHAKTRSLFMPGSLTWQTTHIEQLIGPIAPDLIVVSQGYAESGVRGLLAARKSRADTVSYIPFGNNNTELNNRFARTRDFACRLIYRLPDRYITISNYQASLLRRFTGDNQDISVINNPADFDYAAPQPEAQYAPGTRLEIAVVGRIVFKQKNQDVLIPMAQSLKNRLNFRIHIIGDGPDRNLLKDKIALSGLSDHFVLHGWMGKNELIPFLTGHTDMILIPSLYEGLPLILLEALYLKKPFLMSRLGLLEEYGVPDCWQFDPRDPEDIARHIASLGTNFDPQRYATLRDRVLAQHSTQRFHAEVATVFGKLLAKTGQNLS